MQREEAIEQLLVAEFATLDAEIVLDTCRQMAHEEAAVREMLRALACTAAGPPPRGPPPGEEEMLRLAMWESEREALRNRNREAEQLEQERRALQLSEEMARAEYARRQQAYAAPPQPPRAQFRDVVMSSVFHLVDRENRVLTKVCFLPDHNVTAQSHDRLRRPGEAGTWEIDDNAGVVMWTPYSLPTGKAELHLTCVSLADGYFSVSQVRVPHGQPKFIADGTGVRRVDRGPPGKEFENGMVYTWSKPAQRPPEPAPPAPASAPAATAPAGPAPAAPVSAEAAAEDDAGSHGIVGRVGYALFGWGKPKDKKDKKEKKEKDKDKNKPSPPQQQQQPPPQLAPPPQPPQDAAQQQQQQEQEQERQRLEQERHRSLLEQEQQEQEQERQRLEQERRRSLQQQQQQQQQQAEEEQERQRQRHEEAMAKAERARQQQQEAQQQAPAPAQHRDPTAGAAASRGHSPVFEESEREWELKKAGMAERMAKLLPEVAQADPAPRQEPPARKAEPQGLVFTSPLDGEPDAGARRPQLDALLGLGDESPRAARATPSPEKRKVDFGEADFDALIAGQMLLNSAKRERKALYGDTGEPTARPDAAAAAPAPKPPLLDNLLDNMMDAPAGGGACTPPASASASAAEPEAAPAPRPKKSLDDVLTSFGASGGAPPPDTAPAVGAGGAFASDSAAQPPESRVDALLNNMASQGGGAAPAEDDDDDAFGFDFGGGTKAAAGPKEAKAGRAQPPADFNKLLGNFM